MRVTIRGKKATAKSDLAQAIADTLKKYLRIPVSVDGMPSLGMPFTLPLWPDLTEPVEIVTRNDTNRPTRTTAERVKAYALELNGALFDLANECRRDDVMFEARALEHEAKALYNRIERLQSHRKWLGERGLPR